MVIDTARELGIITRPLKVFVPRTTCLRCVFHSGKISSRFIFISSVLKKKYIYVFVTDFIFAHHDSMKARDQQFSDKVICPRSIMIMILYNQKRECFRYWQIVRTWKKKNKLHIIPIQRHEPLKYLTRY